MNEVKENPLVSIITVTFNASETVASTMDSVTSQTARNYEHIIMDGQSTDDTLDLVNTRATEKTRVFSSPDLGIYDAMNKAMGVAKGKYLLFLNAGDRFASAESLDRFLAACETDIAPDIVYGQTVLIDKAGTVLGERHLTAPEQLTHHSFKDGMLVCHQAFMVRKDIAPLYDLQYRFSADYEWCIRCLQNMERSVYLGDEPVIHYLSEGVTIRNHKASLKERFDIMCRYYGTLPTVSRHFKFAARYLRKRKTSVNNQ